MEDIPKFWAQRPLLERRVLPYLWWPVSSACIERSYSLAGVCNVRCTFRVTFFFQPSLTPKTGTSTQRRIEQRQWLFTAMEMWSNGSQRSARHEGGMPYTLSFTEARIAIKTQGKFEDGRLNATVVSDYVASLANNQMNYCGLCLCWFLRDARMFV